ncbi:hypothetical protein [Methanobrevibacter sp.]|nr:hypothetical protein [Methanobrevibacter sp.]MDO5822937.1 hypothetical protein [Methanobrevibacter sp.]
MDKDELRCLQYVSLVQDLENEFGGHVEGSVKEVQIKSFLYTDFVNLIMN